jgi:hypothetical protein
VPIVLRSLSAKEIAHEGDAQFVRLTLLNNTRRVGPVFRIGSSGF